MSGADDMRAALECRMPQGAVPIWELEFQAWDAASGRHVVLGHEFEALSPSGQSGKTCMRMWCILTTQVIFWRRNS